VLCTSLFLVEKKYKAYLSGKGGKNTSFIGFLSSHHPGWQMIASSGTSSTYDQKEIGAEYRAEAAEECGDRLFHLCDRTLALSGPESRRKDG